MPRRKWIPVVEWHNPLIDNHFLFHLLEVKESIVEFWETTFRRVKNCITLVGLKKLITFSVNEIYEMSHRMWNYNATAVRTSDRHASIKQGGCQEWPFEMCDQQYLETRKNRYSFLFLGAHFYSRFLHSKNVKIFNVIFKLN